MKPFALLALAGIPFFFASAQENAPGLRLTITGKSGDTDTHSTELAAMYVAEGEAATPFVSAGQFQAKWEGFLNLESRSRLYFSFSGNGKASLKVSGETILEAEGYDLSTEESERHRLNSGQHPIEIHYQSPEKEAGQFRLNWRGREFARETVPAQVLSRKPGTLEGDILRNGRNLVSRSGCVRCHQAGGLDANKAMPELSQDAPSFAGIGSRLDKAWMASWIRNPAGHRPSPRMPSLLGSLPPAAVQDIAEWLSQQTGEPPAALQPATDKSLSKGKRLFHNMGCLGCHDKEVGKAPAKAKHQRIPLSFAGHKFKPGALRDFLQEPAGHYKWIRMPDFSFSQEEAAQLAQYLRSIQSPRPLQDVKGNAAKGFKYAKQTGCMNCPIPGSKDIVTAPALAILDTGKGCLSPAPGNLPDYALENHERSAIREFLSKAQPSLGQRSLREFAHRQVESLQCNTCHPMHGKLPHIASLPDLTPESNHAAGDVEAAAHAAGKKKNPPDLTLIGEKLTVGWMEELFTAKLPYKPRPWMEMRMPAFHARGELLANGLAAHHGFAPSPNKQPIQTKGWTETGQQLASTNGGFACVACHAIGENPALAPFEGQGLNFTYSRGRLNHEWYLRWMLNPQRISPQSIMPRYSDEEGYSTLTDVLEGNAADQFNAIWQYIQLGKDL